MKEIELSEALQLLEEARGLEIVERDFRMDVTVLPATHQLPRDEPNIFLRIEVENAETSRYYRFLSKDNVRVRISRDQMCLMFDSPIGPAPVTVRLLSIMPLEPWAALRGKLLPDENPTQFDYLHAIRAVAARTGHKQVFDLADAGMQLRQGPTGGSAQTRMSISTSKALDQEAAATVLEEVGRFLRTQDVELVELMDGSYYIPTTHGAAFLTLDESETVE